MEEFHVTPAFAAWFAEQVGLGPDAAFDGAWHSLSDQDGETDLLLRVQQEGDRIAILIENKVAAPEQEAQDQRYHIRGARAQEAGRYDRFVTAICAPQVYLDGLSAVSAYEHRVPYEAIRDWYDKQGGPRAAWRRAIFAEAIEQGRRGYVMKIHAGKTAFHEAYWRHLQAKYPTFVMARPGPKGAKSDWMIFKSVGFPKGVKLVHKNDQACVDLEFERTLAIELAQRRRNGWPEEVRVLQRGKSAALSLLVPSCDMERPFAEQLIAVETALEAASKLAFCAAPSD